MGVLPGTLIAGWQELWSDKIVLLKFTKNWNELWSIICINHMCFFWHSESQWLLHINYWAFLKRIYASFTLYSGWHLDIKIVLKHHEIMGTRNGILTNQNVLFYAILKLKKVFQIMCIKNFVKHLQTANLESGNRHYVTVMWLFENILH